MMLLPSVLTALLFAAPPQGDVLSEGPAALYDPLQALLEQTPWDSGFSGAGGRSRDVRPGADGRLTFDLSRRDADAATPLQDGSKLFRNQWLLARLRAIAGLAEPVLIDEISRRSGPAGPALCRRQAVELTGAPEALAAAERLLDQVIAANSRWLTVTATLWSRPLPQGESRELAPALLDAAATAALRAARDGSDWTVFAAPTLTVQGGQVGTLLVATPHDYVADVAVHQVRSLAASYSTRIVRSVRDGFALAFAPMFEPESNRVAFDLRLALNAVRLPIRSFEASLAGGEKVTIQLPEARAVTWGSSEMTWDPSIAAIHVTGLTQARWSDGGEPETLELELLLEPSIATPAGRGSGGVAAGEVLGFDPSNRKAFVRLTNADGKHVAIETGRVEFRRGGSKVGSGMVITASGDPRVVLVDDGATLAGDVVVIEQP